MKRRLLIFVALALAMSRSATLMAAAAQASVDRDRVRLNESLTYTLRFEGEPNRAPDLTSLEADFDILERSDNTRIQGSNGQYTQFTEWVVVLMPSATGTFTIPPVTVGGLVSNPVTVVVLAAGDGEALGDIFMEVNAEPQHPFVQAETVYTVSLFLGIDTRGSRLSEPQVTGGEVIIEKLGDDRQFQVEREGRRFIVIERRYAIFPQEAGNLTIEPVRFETQVLDGRRFSRIQRFTSDAMELMVKGAVAPPPEYAGANWLPARSLRLSERFSGDAAGLISGIPATRSLTLTAHGVLATQLPELSIMTMDPIKQYPDQPELDNAVTGEGLQATRTERFAVIATRAGDFELPGVTVPWFNVIEERWETARLARRLVAVSPDPDQPVFALPDVEGATPDQPLAAGPWRRVSAALALGWASTVILMLAFTRRRGGAPAKAAAAQRERRRRRNVRLLSQIRQACQGNDPARSRDLLLQWGELRFPEHAPPTLGALAARLNPEFAQPLTDLEAALYGRDEDYQWQGDTLLAALKSIDAATPSRRPAADDGLLPLYR